MTEQPVTVEVGTGEGREVYEVQSGESFAEVTDGAVWVQVTVPEGADSPEEDSPPDLDLDPEGEDTESELAEFAPEYTSTETQEETDSDRVFDVDRVRCAECGEQYPSEWSRCHECGTENRY